MGVSSKQEKVYSYRLSTSFEGHTKTKQMVTSTIILFRCLYVKSKPKHVCMFETLKNGCQIVGYEF